MSGQFILMWTGLGSVKIHYRKIELIPLLLLLLNSYVCVLFLSLMIYQAFFCLRFNGTSSVVTVMRNAVDSY